MKYCRVRFRTQYGLSEKAYYYKTIENDLQNGDLLIVETGNTYSIGVFQGYVSESEYATKFLIAKLDISNIEKRKEQALQKQEIEKIIEIQKLTNKFSTEHEGDPDVEDFVSELNEKLFELQDSIVEN